MTMQAVFTAIGFSAQRLDSVGSNTLQQVLRRQRLADEKCSKGKRNAKVPGVQEADKKADDALLLLPIEIDKRIARLKANWEKLPSNNLDWILLTQERVIDMTALVGESLAAIRAHSNLMKLRQISHQIFRQVNLELPGITECKELLQSTQLPEGYRFQGSVREVWGFQNTSDIDLVLSKRRPKGFEVFNFVPGFCALRRMSTVERICRNQGQSELYKPGRRFTDSSATSTVLSPGKYRRTFSNWRVEKNQRLLSEGRLGASERKLIHEHGPAVTHGHCFIVWGKEENREIDFVCTIRLNSWPRWLSEWALRQSRSPAGLSKRVRQASVHVVPIGAYKGATVHSSHAWRYSYNEIECRMIEEFGPFEGAAYALLKKICQRYLKPAGFKSYHAKTCFFWLLLLDKGNQLPSVLELVLAAVDLMLRCAKNGYMPNYFMPNENVLRESVMPSKVALRVIAEYLESFPASGERITDLSVIRLRSFIEQLSADIKSAPPPQLAKDLADCFCQFNDVSRTCLDEKCVHCDSLNQYQVRCRDSGRH